VGDIGKVGMRRKEEKKEGDKKERGHGVPCPYEKRNWE
jgi:hypothetical protein